MERNYDEVISEMLIELHELQEQGRKFNQRLDLTIRRMVKTEAAWRKLSKGLKDPRKGWRHSIRN